MRSRLRTNVTFFRGTPTWKLITMLTGLGMIAVALAILISPGPGVLSVLDIPGTGLELPVFAGITAACGLFKIVFPDSSLAHWMLFPLVVWDGAAFDYVMKLPAGSTGKSFTGATIIAFMIIVTFTASTRDKPARHKRNE